LVENNGQFPDSHGELGQGEKYRIRKIFGVSPLRSNELPSDQSAHRKSRLIEDEFPDASRIGNFRRMSYALADMRQATGGHLARYWDREIEQRTAFNLLPVWLGGGCFAYFIAPAEPSLVVLAATSVILAAFAHRQKLHGVMFHICIAMLVFLIGMTSASLRTKLKSTPVIERQITTRITGLVVERTKNHRGSPRYLIRLNSAEEIARENLPKLIRLSASSRHLPFEAGQSISGLARMFPFSGPAYPGGYDFYFHNWFRSMGGTGFFMGKPEEADIQLQPDYLELISFAVGRWRKTIENRILTALPGEAGDIANALITGNRTGIDKETQESLRKSGLAHILAISGLHMALVTLTIIGMVRAIFAIFPALVLRYPAHKFAAGAGFLSATSYLIISGAGIATQRAWIMISIMLLATLLDRRAITMRSVSIAALCILTVSPESLLSPGFQMSFAAVAALVAAYEAWRSHRAGKPKKRYYAPNSRLAGMVISLGKYGVGLAFTSLVAGTATAIFAAYHFHRVAPMGLIANLLAMPVVSIAVIPLGLISMLAMPYGMEKLTLSPLGTAIESVVDISNWVNSFGANGITGILPPAFILFSSAALLVLTLLKTRLRFLAMVFVFPALFSLRGPPTPDILIAETGRAIAVNAGEGNLKLLYPRRNKFVSEIWLRAWPQRDPDPAAEKSLLLRSDITRPCNKEQCIVEFTNGVRLHVVYKPELLKQACMNADILVAPRLWWVRCGKTKPALVLKRRDFEQFGTHAIRFSRISQENASDAGTDPIRKPAFLVTRALASTSRPWDRKVAPKL